MAASSSSTSSATSSASVPQPDMAAAYDVLTPEWWDEMDWDFDAQSEDDEPQTDGEEDLQFLVDGALEGFSEDDLRSWGEDPSSDEEVTSAWYLRSYRTCP